MQVLFNYGNVYITVGGSELVFEDVADPVTVQKDIDLVRLSLIERKREKETKEERDRMAELLAAYHNDPLTNTNSFVPGSDKDLDEHEVQ